MKFLQTLQAAAKMFNIPAALVTNLSEIKFFLELDLELIHFLLQVFQAFRAYLGDVDVLFDELIECLVLASLSDLPVKDVKILGELKIVIVHIVLAA